MIQPHPPVGKQARKTPSFPRVPLYGAIALIAFAAAAIVFGQKTGIGTVRLETGAPLAIRDIILTEAADGRVIVNDAKTGVLISEYANGEGGFVRGAMRPLNRMRMVANVPNDHPFRVIKWDNGAVSLSDTATGERFYLNAFGADNAGAFAELLGHQGRSAQ